MKHVWLMMAALFLAAGIAGAVEDDDMIMGNYHGGFTSADWASRSIRAQVVAQSKVAHRAVLFIGENEESALRVETAGKVEDGVAVFKDDLDLGTLGKFEFSARIVGETMTGALTGAGRRGQAASFELKRVFIEPPTLGMAPPADAIMLFDGTNFALWERTPLHWCMFEGNAMEVCNSSLKTIEEYGSGLYHIEFQTPFMPSARGQSRGNSGVYILGRYEVQVLDTFGLEPADNFCGGLYSLATPIADAILPPKQWQTYDITFHAPVFDANGAKTANARIHAVHNGIVIHDNLELSSGTPGGVSEQEATTGPLLLQNHGDRVRFRNIWFSPEK